MSKASLKNCLARKYPKLRKNNDFFYFDEARVTIHGFALDVPPSRVSVLEFVIPLFDKIEGLHLGLSSEIARFGPLASTPVDDLCLRIQDSLASHPVMQDDFDDLETFKSYLRSADQSGIYPRWCSALVDCLEERPESAVEKVNLLMSETEGGLIFPTSALRELHAVLQTRPEEALAFVAQWRDDNLKTFWDGSQFRKQADGRQDRPR